MTYDLDALRAALNAESAAMAAAHAYDGEDRREVVNAWKDAVVASRQATKDALRSGLLDDAALGRAVRAAAKDNGPELEAMAKCAFRWIGAVCPSDEQDVEDVSRAMGSAARALIAMGGK